MQHIRRIRIPSLGYFPERMHIHLRIRPSKRQYLMDIHVNGQVKERIPISITLEDLDRIAAGLHAELESLVDEHGSLEVIPQARVRLGLEKLATEGYFVFLQVFKHEQTRKAILTLLSQQENAHIQVSSEGFALPWELLYPIMPDNSLSFEHFWGFRHIISRTIVRDDAEFYSPNILAAPQTKVGLLFYELPGAREIELPFFERLHANGAISLDQLPALDPNKLEVTTATLAGPPAYRPAAREPKLLNIRPTPLPWTKAPKVMKIATIVAEMPVIVP
jgi:hypothetical protein